MTRICWRLVDRISRRLTPDERDAVCGDIAELKLTGGQALREVLGLVARREAEVWQCRRPWLVLGAAVVPLAILLGLVAQRIADTGSIYGWMYVNNWSPAILDSPGARRDLIGFVQMFALQCVAMIATSWVCGLVLGSLVRRAIAINAALFFIVLLTGGEFLRWIVRDVAEVPTPYVPLARSWLFLASDNPLSVEVFSTTFFGLVFPLIVPTLLVMLPLLAGMRRVTPRVVSVPQAR